ncbi:MAG TPA: flagellar hook capping FlgD N-terminal domain-containing protein [Verrucomicrobiae bacterium]|jgi:flagellar basal-body rod modification protein FlgD
MTSVPSIFNNTPVGADVADPAERVHKSTLDQNDFLKLLVTKMSAQDPMNPQADTEFIAQMAQFSSLEQAKSMTADMAMLKSQQEVLTANGLIGRNVAVTGSDNKTIQGMVTSVATNDGAPEVVVNGKNYSLDSVSLISPFTASV